MSLPCLFLLVLGISAMLTLQQCSAVHCTAVHCSTLQYTEVLKCSAVQYRAGQSSPVQCSAMQCSAVQCGAIQYSVLQHKAVQGSSLLTFQLSIELSTPLPANPIHPSVMSGSDNNKALKLHCALWRAFQCSDVQHIALEFCAVLDIAMQCSAIFSCHHPAQLILFTAPLLSGFLKILTS